MDGLHQNRWIGGWWGRVGRRGWVGGFRGELKEKRESFYSWVCDQTLHPYSSLIMEGRWTNVRGNETWCPEVQIIRGAGRLCCLYEFPHVSILLPVCVCCERFFNPRRISPSFFFPRRASTLQGAENSLARFQRTPIILSTFLLSIPHTHYSDFYKSFNDTN